MPTLYPLRFEPILKPAIWGGRRLKPFFGLQSAKQAVPT